jgi:hypothetical protein
MRSFRFVPLVVLVFSASVAADDHRVDLNFALTFCAGSTLTGLQISASTPDVVRKIAAAEPKFAFVVDQSNYWGSHGDDDQDMSRNVTMAGGRLSLPLEGQPKWKVLPELLTGWVHTTIGDDSTNALGLAPGIGVERVSEYGSNGMAFGGRAHAGYVFVTGSGDNFWRASVGLVLRWKKEP